MHAALLSISLPPLIFTLQFSKSVYIPIPHVVARGAVLFGGKQLVCLFHCPALFARLHAAAAKSFISSRAAWRLQHTRSLSGVMSMQQAVTFDDELVCVALQRTATSNLSATLDSSLGLKSPGKSHLFRWSLWAARMGFEFIQTLL